MPHGYPLGRRRRPPCCAGPGAGFRCLGRGARDPDRTGRRRARSRRSGLASHGSLAERAGVRTRLAGHCARGRSVMADPGRGNMAAERAGRGRPDPRPLLAGAATSPPRRLCAAAARLAALRRCSLRAEQRLEGPRGDVRRQRGSENVEIDGTRSSVLAAGAVPGANGRPGGQQPPAGVNPIATTTRRQLLGSLPGKLAAVTRPHSDRGAQRTCGPADSEVGQDVAGRARSRATS